MAFVPSYGYARAVTRGTRNSARAHKEKEQQRPRAPACEVAGAGLSLFKNETNAQKALGVKITPTAAGSTMSYYTAGTKTMPKICMICLKQIVSHKQVIVF